MCEPNAWCHLVTKAVILQSVRTDSRVRSGCLACLKCTCSGTGTVQSIAWATLTCFSTHTCTCIWSCRTAFVWAAPGEQHVCPCRPRWVGRAEVLPWCAVANVNQESVQLEQIVAGVSAEVSDCSQLWTCLILISIGVPSLTVTQHSSVWNSMQVYIPIETSNPVTGERAWRGFL